MLSVTTSSRRRRIWFICVGGVLLLLVAASAWVGLRAMSARDSLQSAAATATTIPDLVRTGDSEAAVEAARQFQNDVNAAAASTSDPVWRLAEYVPWLGSNFHAVRVMSEVAADIASVAVVPLAAAAADIDLSALGFRDGGIDVAPLAQSAPALEKANAGLHRAVERINGLEPPSIPVVADAVGQLRNVAVDAAAIVDGLDRAAAILPAMVGTDEPRTYLLLVLNNAESRSLAGIAGAGAVLRFENGRVTIERAVSSADFDVSPDPVVGLSPATTALFGDLPGRFIQNTASAFDFSETASAAAGIWRLSSGQSVDGVIAIDAVSIGYLLEATGPLQAGPFTLDADNAVPTLLADAYAQIADPSEQDEAFASVAQAIFETLSSGGADANVLLSALGRSTEEHRLHVWSARPEEEARIEGTALATMLPADEDTARVGVFFNDVTGAKLDYYATPSTTVTVDDCVASPRVRVAVEWKNTVPADAATSLPDYVLGPELTVAARGETLTRVAVAGPQGWLVDSYSFDDGQIGVQTAAFEDRSVIQHEFVTAPGGSHSIVVDFTAPEGTSLDDWPIEVVSTPLVHANEVKITHASCAG